MSKLRSTWRRWAMLAVIAAVVLHAGQATSLGASTDAPAEAEEAERLSFSVRPAREPEPALRHLLRVSAVEQEPGNAAPYYLRATMSLGDEPEQDERVQEAWNQVYDWTRLRPDELPREQVRRFLASRFGAMDLLNLAVLREDCNWETGVRELGFNAWLPELQSMRRLGSVLQLEAKLHAAEGDVDAAVQSLRVGFTMARHVAEEPLLINNMVSIANTLDMADTLRDIIATGETTGFYWPLADLQARLPRMTSLDLERQTASLTLRLDAGRTLDEQVVSQEQANEMWGEMIVHIDGPAMVGNQSEIDLGYELIGLGALMLQYSEAKRELVARGRDRDTVETMPVRQAVMLHWMEQYEREADELFKWFLLPYHEIRDRLPRRAISNGDGWPAVNPLLAMLPSLERAVESEVRMHRRLAMLRCLEAIRLHAAEAGELPQTLSQIAVVPVPSDPATDEPFHYERDGDAFILEPADDQVRVTREDQWQVRMIFD